MITRKYSKSLFMAALSVGLMSPVSAMAGEITRPDTASDFKWKSTECARPIARPASSFTPAGKSAATASQDRLMRYALDIEIYIDCIQREAQRDFQKAQEQMQITIERDLEKDTQVMNDMMLNAAKTMR